MVQELNTVRASGSVSARFWLLLPLGCKLPVATPNGMLSSCLCPKRQGRAAVSIPVRFFLRIREGNFFPEDPYRLPRLSQWSERGHMPISNDKRSWESECLAVLASVLCEGLAGVENVRGKGCESAGHPVGCCWAPVPPV